MAELQTTTTGVYTGKTLTQLEDGVLSKLGEPSQSFTRYTKAEIDAYLNTALRDFCVRTRLLKTNAITILKAGIRFYKLPTGFHDFVNPRWVARYRDSGGSGYTRLARTSVQKLDNVSGTWRDEVGSPKGLFLGPVYGNTRMIGVYPVPSVDGETYAANQDTGVVISGSNVSIGNNVTGVHKTGANSAFYVDTEGRDLAALGVMVGMVIENLTDGSKGAITAIGNSAATNDKISVTLAGGTDNDFDVGDSVIIYAGEYGVLTSWASDTEQYLFNTEFGVLGAVTTPNGNLEYEFVRKAAQISGASQYPEIPEDFHEDLEWYAASILLGTEHDGRIDKNLGANYMTLWEAAISKGIAMCGDNLGFPETLEPDSDYIGDGEGL